MFPAYKSLTIVAVGPNVPAHLHLHAESVTTTDRFTIAFFSGAYHDFVAQRGHRFQRPALVVAFHPRQGLPGLDSVRVDDTVAAAGAPAGGDGAGAGDGAATGTSDAAKAQAAEAKSVREQWETTIELLATYGTPVAITTATREALDAARYVITKGDKGATTAPQEVYAGPNPFRSTMDAVLLKYKHNAATGEPRTSISLLSENAFVALYTTTAAAGGGAGGGGAGGAAGAAATAE